MIALDTNILVRVVTNDTPDEALCARTLVTSHDVFVGTTVVLEADWVLRTVYRLPRRDVAAALRGFFGLPRVTVEARGAVLRALTWANEGMDIADALHLSLGADHDGFATFDRALQAQGRARAVTMVCP